MPKMKNYFVREGIVVLMLLSKKKLSETFRKEILNLLCSELNIFEGLIAGFVSLFNDITTFLGYLMRKAILVKKQRPLR